MKRERTTQATTGVDVEVSPVGPKEHHALAALMQLYVYDFSEMLGLDVADEGRYQGPTVEGRDAFFVRVGGKLAGFALDRRREPAHRRTRGP